MNTYSDTVLIYECLMQNRKIHNVRYYDTIGFRHLVCIRSINCSVSQCLTALISIFEYC